MFSAKTEDGTHFFRIDNFLSGQNMFKMSKMKGSCHRLFTCYLFDFKHVFVHWVSLSALLWLEGLFFPYQGKFSCVDDIAYVISWETFISLRIENIPMRQRFIQSANYYWSNLICFSIILFSTHVGIVYM